MYRHPNLTSLSGNFSFKKIKKKCHVMIAGLEYVKGDVIIRKT